MNRRIVCIASGIVLITAATLRASVLAQTASALPEAGTDLEPGRYVSDVVGPAITFEVDAGWQAGPAGPGPIFTLLRSSEPGTVVSVTRFDGDVFVDSCDPTSLSQVEVSVPRLIAVIAGNPYLNPGTPFAVEVDGFTGLALDVATPAYTECRLEWLLIWALPVEEGGEFVQVADQQSRFIALDVDGDVVVVAIESLPGVPFGELLESSMELVESMTIVPGELVAPQASPSPGTSGASGTGEAMPFELGG